MVSGNRTVKMFCWRHNLRERRGPSRRWGVFGTGGHTVACKRRNRRKAPTLMRRQEVYRFQLDGDR